MIYSVYVRYYNEYAKPEDQDGHGMVEANCFVAGDTINEIVDYMTNYFGEKEIDEIHCKPISPDNFIEFRGTDKNLFNKIESDIIKNVVW